LHHQWLPDKLRFEGTLEHQGAVERLRAMGHSVTGGSQGDAHSIWLDPRTGLYRGAEDRRINGKVSAY
jgi:gamma-glutamyltranspeptidase/glutathione hydrolase